MTGIPLTVAAAAAAATTPAGTAQASSPTEAAPAATELVLDASRDALVAAGRLIDASQLERDLTLEADVAIVGSGAGGAVTAEILAGAGLRVVIVEEGPLATRRDFHMREADAYPNLYQESAARKTADKAINILQGRCAGGGTTVNWTSSFRTPPTTLAFWERTYGLRGYGVADLAPWFARMETRLAIAPWIVPPNGNNSVLARGAGKLGIATGIIRRNVRGCADLGYCGMGCPLDAKQSMLVTTLPGALAAGATLVTRVRAQRFTLDAERVVALACTGMDASGVRATGRRVTVRARTFVAAGGGINTPALLLASGVPDPYALIGRRTFLHPVVVSAAVMPDEVAAWSGAPQSVYSDHFLDTLAPEGPVGFKLEAPPVHPVLAAITLPNHGFAHAGWMRRFPKMQVLLALLRDGFHPASPGGTVSLRPDGTPLLDYPLTPYLWEGARRAFAAMAEIQFAAGATAVMPIHGDGNGYRDWASARAAIAGFTLAPLVTPVVSAHVMGGCPLGPDPRRAVVDVDGRQHHLDNLYVIDGSLFPTSIGANPQLSIYGFAARLASRLAAQLAPGRATEQPS